MSSDPVRAWLSRPESLTQLKRYVATYQAPHITADELVSACVERMLERSDIFEGEVDKVSAWARRVAWSSALNVHRTEANQLKHRAARSAEWADDVGLNGVEHSTPETACEQAETRELMEASLSLSPHGHRFVAMATKEAKARHVADELGVNRNTFWGKYRRWQADVRLLNDGWLDDTEDQSDAEDQSDVSAEDQSDASAEEIINEVAVL